MAENNKSIGTDLMEKRIELVNEISERLSIEVSKNDGIPIETARILVKNDYKNQIDYLVARELNNLAAINEIIGDSARIGRLASVAQGFARNVHKDDIKNLPSPDYSGKAESKPLNIAEIAKKVKSDPTYQGTQKLKNLTELGDPEAKNESDRRIASAEPRQQRLAREVTEAKEDAKKAEFENDIETSPEGAQEAQRAAQMYEQKLKEKEDAEREAIKPSRVHNKPGGFYEKGPREETKDTFDGGTPFNENNKQVVKADSFNSDDANDPDNQDSFNANELKSVAEQILSDRNFGAKNKLNDGSLEGDLQTEIGRRLSDVDPSRPFNNSELAQVTKNSVEDFSNKQNQNNNSDQSDDASNTDESKNNFILKFVNLIAGEKSIPNDKKLNISVVKEGEGEVNQVELLVDDKIVSQATPNNRVTDITDPNNTKKNFQFDLVWQGIEAKKYKVKARGTGTNGKIVYSKTLDLDFTRKRPPTTPSRALAAGLAKGIRGNEGLRNTAKGAGNLVAGAGTGLQGAGAGLGNIGQKLEKSGKTADGGLKSGLGNAAKRFLGKDVAKTGADIGAVGNKLKQAGDKIKQQVVNAIARAVISALPAIAGALAFLLVFVMFMAVLIMVFCHALNTPGSGWVLSWVVPEEFKKICKDSPLAGPECDPNTSGSSAGTQNVTASSGDQYMVAVLSILESPTIQGRLDVAQVIANRAANNYSNHGTSVRDQAFASGQFEPFFPQNGIGKNDIQDEESAVKALQKAKGFAAGTARRVIREFLAATQDPALVQESASKIGVYMSFRGSNLNGNKTGGEFQRNPNENYFFQEDGDKNSYKQGNLKSLFNGVKVNPTQSKSPNQNLDTLAKVTGMSEVLAVGTKPSSYSDLSADHLKFLEGVAKARLYTAYPDKGGLNPGLQKAFDAMKTAATKDGKSLSIVSGYRSFNDQVGTFFAESGVDSPIKDYWYDKITVPELATVSSQYTARAKWSAPPGYSEHSTGLAIDINSLDKSFSKDLAYDWLKKNAAKYGFIESYPATQDANPLGTGYEPWHWRWDGSTEYPNAEPMSKLVGQTGDKNTSSASSSNDPCATSDSSVNSSTKGVINAKGKLSLLEAAKRGSIGKKPDSRCWYWVAEYIVESGGFGNVSGAENMPYVEESAGTNSGASAAFNTGAYWNKNLSTVGLVNLLDSNPNANPYNAPAGSIVVISYGYRGAGATSTDGDIAVADGNGNFYNGGEMKYPPEKEWNGSYSKYGTGPGTPLIGSGKLVGIYVPAK